MSEVLGPTDVRNTCPHFLTAVERATADAIHKMNPIPDTVPQLGRLALGEGRSNCETCRVGVIVTTRASKTQIVEKSSSKLITVYRLDLANPTVRSHAEPACVVVTYESAQK